MFGFVWKKRLMAALEHNGQLIDHWRVSQNRARLLEAQLAALRANCFIHNEKGHIVRYINASEERRAKAEGCEA